MKPLDSLECLKRITFRMSYIYNPVFKKIYRDVCRKRSLQFKKKL